MHIFRIIFIEEFLQSHRFIPNEQVALICFLFQILHGAMLLLHSHRQRLSAASQLGPE